MNIGGDYKTLTALTQDKHIGIKLRDYLRGDMGLSSRLVKSAKMNKGIFVDGKSVRVSYVLKSGQNVKVVMKEESGIPPQDIPIKVLYEDIDVLVIDKPPFTVVHPTHTYKDFTLLNGVRKYSLEKGEDYKPHVVNRLDRDTSGLMIVSKNGYSHFELVKDMDSRSIEKIYLGLVYGRLDKESGKIEAPIGIREGDIRRVVMDGGRESLTEYRVLEYLGPYTLCEFKLITGRTHQIRVHMSHIGHPLVGDTLYGCDTDQPINRQALHSYKLRFTSPRTGSVFVESEIPKDIYALIQEYKNR